MANNHKVHNVLFHVSMSQPSKSTCTGDQPGCSWHRLEDQGGGEKGGGGHAGDETTCQQAGVEVAHERGEPVVRVVDVAGHRQ